jgi:hypothetical protein
MKAKTARIAAIVSALLVLGGCGAVLLDDAVTYFGKVKGMLSVELDRIYHLD